MKNLNVSAASLMDHTPAEIHLRVQGRKEEIKQLAYLTAYLHRVEKMPRYEKMGEPPKTAKEAKRDFEELLKRRDGRKSR
ncbi:MAG: hypothetical protein LLG45_13310 [Actinomycetia bacterium]|nr:hypothetical protein [Actinomycetes bacterium]